MSQIKVIGNASLVFGTIEVAGTVFGQVESANIELTGDEEGVPDDMGGFQSYILSNDHYKISLTAIFPSNTAIPARGDRVDITVLNVAATILGAKLVYERGKARKIEITAAHWVSIGGALGVGPTVTTLPAVPAVPPPSED